MVKSTCAGGIPSICRMDTVVGYHCMPLCIVAVVSSHVVLAAFLSSEQTTLSNLEGRIDAMSQDGKHFKKKNSKVILGQNLLEIYLFFLFLISINESIELMWQEFIDNLRKLGEKERHCFLSVELSVSLAVWRLYKFNVFCALNFFLSLSFKAAKKANRYPGRGMRSSTSFSPSLLSCRIDRHCFAWVHFSRVA